MAEFIHHFGIDWKLLLAQVVNFAILFFILQKFAFTPIVRILRRRREEIERGIRLTEEAEERASLSREEREKILKKTRLEALSIVSKAESAGKQKKEEIVRAGMIKAETVFNDAKLAIEEEKRKMNDVVYENAKEFVLAGIERVLGKMPAGARDEALINEALREVKKMDYK